ncbi:DUF6541 family protein [Georgenia thermotolerans]|uniref:Uncharacterized protein n=1 Tax=Georgenia thermotolerans TaxID=527326 RepID=A0A7J5UT87_9MICO|nr:DUF6541 family protein [Georgenia thermotolerans]KAE8765253.1 hypothetical protein GB883_04795 [Georgenia thermotolerans]
MLGWTAHDLALIAGATALLLLPGLLVLRAALGPRSLGPMSMAAAPLVTAGLAYLTGVLTGVAGVRYSPGTVLALTVLVAAGALGLRRTSPTWRRRGRTSPALAGLDAAPFGPVPVPAASMIVAGVATATAMGVALWTWAAGLGRLAVVPQEHDTVTHTLITAYIARTGDAAPGQEWPADLVTGTPDRFYPAGLHKLAALPAQLGLDPVTALNAVTVALFAVVLPMGMLALGSLLRWRGAGPVAGGAAAMAAALAYRPVYAMMHDGGVLSNAAALALVPGAVAVLVAAGRRPARELPGNVLLMAGAFSIYPSAVLAIAGGVLAWVVGDALARRPRREQVGRWLWSVGGAGLVAGACAVPALVVASRAAATPGQFPSDVPTSTLAGALALASKMPYGGFLDPGWHRHQVLLAVLVALGLVCAVTVQRALGLVLAWAVWTVFFVLFAVGAGGPAVRAAAGLFYNSFIRISGLYAPYQWLLVGVLAVTAAVGGMSVLARLAPVLLARRQRATWDAAALAVAVAVVAVVGLHYAPVNARALQERYRYPQFVRVGPDDRAAFAYLENHVRRGEEVMNNGNDGSTYLYVYDGVPVVNVQTLPNGPDSLALLTRFNRIDTDAEIRRLVREHDIRWVYVDEEAPLIGAPFSQQWLPGGLYSTAPGLDGLDHVRSLEEVFRSGTVTVYRVADSIFAGARDEGVVRKGP